MWKRKSPDIRVKVTSIDPGVTESKVEDLCLKKKTGEEIKEYYGGKSDSSLLDGYVLSLGPPEEVWSNFLLLISW